MRRVLVCCGALALLKGCEVALGALRVPTEVVVTRYPNGQVQSESQYRNGMLDGTSRGWYENGALQFERVYRGVRRERIVVGMRMGPQCSSFITQTA